MMTYAAVPAISTLVEMTTSGEPLGGVRIDGVRDTRLDLSLPAATAERPAVGDAVTLRWAAGPRGRYAVTGTVIEPPADNRLTVAVSGPPVIEQHRHFVRGGGGEQVWLHRYGTTDSAEYAGWIRDISEQGIRAHFADVAVTDGDPLRLRVDLGPDAVDVTGTVLAVRDLPDAGAARPMREIVAVIAADEVQAQVIRRYVLQQQLLTRSRTAGD